MLTLTLPYPPTVNTYWRVVNGRPIISAKGRTYRKDTQVIVFIQSDTGFKPIAERVSVNIIAHPPDKRKRDLDNILKALLDAMQHAGVYEDDGQIDELSIKRGEVRNPGEVEVTIGRVSDEADHQEV